MVEILQAVTPDEEIGNIDVSDRIYVVSRGKVKSAERVPRHLLKPKERATQTICVSSKFGLLLQISECDVHIREWTNQEGTGEEDYYMEMESFMAKEGVNLAQERDAIAEPPIWACLEAKKPLLGLKLCPWSETLVAAWSLDNTFFMFDLGGLTRNAKRSPLWRKQLSVQDVAFLEDERVAVVSEDSLQLFNAADGEDISSSKFSDESLRGLACASGFEGDSKSIIAVGMDDGSVHLFQTNNLEQRGSFQIESEELEGNVNANALAWMSESVLAVGFRSAVAIGSDEDDDDPPPLPALAVVQLDLQSAQVIASQFLSDPLDYSIRDKSWEHRFFMQRIPHLNGMVLTSTWSRNMAIFTIADGGDFAIERNKVMMRQDPVETPEICGGSIWSLAERPWVLADNGDDDPEIGFQENPFVLGMAMALCVKAKVAPDHIYGTDGELEGKPHFAPPPTIVVSTTDGILEHFAFADTEYSTTSSAATIPGMCLTTSSLPTARSVPSPAKSDNKVNSKPTSGMGGSAFDFSSSAPSSTTFGATAQSKAGDAQSGKTDLFTGKSTGAGSLFSTSSSSSSSTEKVSNGSLFGEASKSAVGSSNSEAKSSFGFGAMSNSLSSQPTQSLFGGSSSSSSTEKVSNGSLFGEASKSAVGSSNSEAKSSFGFGAMSNSLSSQPTQSLFGGSSTSFGTAAAAQPQGNGTSSLFGNSGGGTSSTGGSLFGSTATTSSFENRSKSETKGDVPFTGAQEGMIYTCRDGVTGYYKDCPPTVTFVPPEQRVFTRDEARILLTDFYKRIDPSKLGGVEGILDKYEGKYSAVFDRLSGKYKDQKVDLSLIAKSSNAIISNANVNDDAKAKADADARAKADADARAKADADARAKADADARAKADADARAKADADARAKADADARAKADANARAKADADARAKADADTRAKADADARTKADADARAKADADTRAKADADARTKADADARAKADADARVKADANARAKANADAKAKANADAETMHVTTMKSNTENVYRETIAGLRESLNEQEARNEKLQAELNTQVRAKRLSSAPRLSLMKLRLEKDEGIYEPRGHLTKMKESLNKSTDPEEETRRLLRSTLNLVQAKDEDMQEDIARMTMTWPENDEELEDKTKTLRDNIEEALSFAQNDVKKLVREGADFLAATRRNYLNYLSLFESVKNQMHSRMRSLQPDGHNSGPSFDQGFESIEHAPQIEASDEELAELLLHLQSANKRVHDLERFREMMEHQMTSLRETLQNQQRTISLSQRNPPDQRDSRRVVTLAASNETYVERQRQLMRRAMSMYKRARTSFDEMRSLYARLNGINSRLKAAIDDVEDIDEIEQGKIGEFSDQSALVPTLSNNGGSPSLTKTYEQELADLDSIDAMIKEHISAQPIIMRDSTGQEMRQARPLKEARSAARKELRWRRSLAAKTSRQSVEADGTLTDDGSLDFINSFSQRRPGLTEKQEEALSHMADPPKLRPVVSEEAVGASWSDTKPGAQTKPSDKKSSTFGPGSGGLFGAKSQSSNEVSGSFASQEPSQEEAEQEKEEKKSSGLFGNTSGSSSSSSLFLGQGGTSQTKNEEAPKPPFTPKKAEGASSSLFGVAGQALSSSNNSQLSKEVTDSNDGKQQNSPEAPKPLFGNTTQQTPSTPSSSSTGLFGASSSSSGLFGTSTPATPSSPAPSVANSERDLTNVDIRKTLAEFYREHKPELISKLDQNMEKYKQNFNHMFDLLEKKYRTKIKLIPNDGTGESSGGSNSVFGSTSMSSGLGGTGSSGFGNQASSNTGFGQSSSGFGQSSSGFGQSSSGFGTSTPSASSFGSSQPLGSSGFGASTSTPVGGSMFGGQQQQQTPGGGNNMDARQRLVEFYQKQNPEKLNSVDKTLERYRGRETELFAQLEKKYGPGSTGFFAGGNTGGQAMGSGGAFGATPGGFGNSSGFGASGSSGGFGSSGFGTPSSNGMGAQSAGANGGGFAGFAGSSSSSFGSPAAATSGSGGFGNSSGGFGSSSGGGASGFGASSSGGSSGFGTNSGFGTSAGGGSSGFNNGGGFGTSSSGSSGGFGSSGFGSAPTGGGFGGNASSFGGNTGGGSGFGGTAGGGGFGGSSGGGFGGFGGNSGGGGGSSFSGSSFTNMRG